MQRETFDQQMRLLMAMWPDKERPSETLMAYWVALGHLDDAVFTQAVGECLRGCTFFPVAAEILNRVERILTAAGVLPTEPERAWLEVVTPQRDWIRQLHQQFDADAPMSKPRRWSHPAIGTVVEELGGVTEIQRADVHREIPYLRKEFIARYGALRQRAIAADLSLLAQALPEPVPALPEETDDPEAKVARIAELRRRNEEYLRGIAR